MFCRSAVRKLDHEKLDGGRVVEGKAQKNSFWRPKISSRPAPGKRSQGSKENMQSYVAPTPPVVGPFKLPFNKANLYLLPWILGCSLVERGSVCPRVVEGRKEDGGSPKHTDTPVVPCRATDRSSVVG